MSTPKGNGDDRATTELAPIEVEALLHDEASSPVSRDARAIDAGAVTVEMLPLVPLEDLEPPEPDRIARGTDPVMPSRPHDTVEARTATIETVPLVPLDDEPPPVAPDRVARGSTAATVAARPVRKDEPPHTARGTDTNRPRRTVERLAIADIIKRK